jgi:GntR family transcriptional regulator
MVDKNSHIPIYLQIQSVLREQISAGELSPGDQIPSEVELANRWSVSRMTVRKAIEGLVAKGDLFRQPGKGTFVTKDVMSYGFSTMLSFSRTLKSRGYKVSTQVLRQEVIPGPQHICHKLNLNPGSEVLVIRRLRFVNEEPVAIHTSYFDQRVFSALVNFDLVNGSLLDSMEQIYGIHMASTKDTVRAGSSSTEVSALLGIKSGRPVLIMEGTAFDERGTPTRYTEAIYNGDMFELAVMNTYNQASSLSLMEAEGSMVDFR